MARRGRVVTVLQGDEVVGLCSFFLLQRPVEVTGAHHRPLWTIVKDYAEGAIAYIDVLLAPAWDRRMHRALVTAITDAHPEVAYGVWYRSKEERDVRYTYRVRR